MKRDHKTILEKPRFNIGKYELEKNINKYLKSLEEYFSTNPYNGWILRVKS